MYKLLRPLFFLLPAETAHNLMFWIIERLQKVPLFLWWVKRNYSVPDPDMQLASTFAGIPLRNPAGIAAGLDKGARLLPFWDALGVGLVEIGTVTPLPQIGNPLPRMFRLVKDEAIINRMGFNNEGMEVIAERIRKFRASQPAHILIGGSIGKNKETPNEEAYKDYIKCYRTLHELVNYFVVNVSSPNTPGLRKLQDGDFLEALFIRFEKVRDIEKWDKKPIFVKIAPDVSSEYLDKLIEWVNATDNCAGLVGFNTTTSREGLNSYDTTHIKNIGNGGLSGPVLYEGMLTHLAYLREKTDKVLVAVGGIDSPIKSQSIMHFKADAFQIYTGLIYQGPGLFKQILKQLKQNK